MVYCADVLRYSPATLTGKSRVKGESKRARLGADLSKLPLGMFANL